MSSFQFTDNTIVSLKETESLKFLQVGQEGDESSKVGKLIAADDEAPQSTLKMTLKKYPKDGDWFYIQTSGGDWVKLNSETAPQLTWSSSDPTTGVTDIEKYLFTLQVVPDTDPKEYILLNYGAGSAFKSAHAGSSASDPPQFEEETTLNPGYHFDVVVAAVGGETAAGAKGKKKLTLTTIILIVIGSLLGAVVLGYLGYWLYKRYKANKDKTSTGSADGASKAGGSVIPANTTTTNPTASTNPSQGGAVPSASASSASLSGVSQLQMQKDAWTAAQEQARNGGSRQVSNGRLYTHPYQYVSTR